MTQRGSSALKCVTVTIGVAVTALAVAGPAAGQNVQAGEQAFRKCRACHVIGAEARNGVGPQLNGILGRRAGTIAGFNYSEANREAGTKGLVWTEEILFRYLENPAAFMPKNKMAFAGVKDEAERRDLIAYLKTFP